MVILSSIYMNDLYGTDLMKERRLYGWNIPRSRKYRRSMERLGLVRERAYTFTSGKQLLKETYTDTGIELLIIL